MQNAYILGLTFRKKIVSAALFDAAIGIARGKKGIYMDMND